MDEKPYRLRVNGRASIAAGDPSIAEFPGAQLLIEVRPEHIFPNCPRYVPNLKTGEVSRYAPCRDVPPVEPAWKGFADFKDVVPPRRA
jgi:hypothetical protein